MVIVIGSAINNLSARPSRLPLYCYGNSPIFPWEKKQQLWWCTLTTIEGADQIIVLNEGEIVEVGDHQQLILLKDTISVM